MGKTQHIVASKRAERLAGRRQILRERPRNIAVRPRSDFVLRDARMVALNNGNVKRRKMTNPDFFRAIPAGLYGEALTMDANAPGQHADIVNSDTQAFARLDRQSRIWQGVSTRFLDGLDTVMYTPNHRGLLLLSVYGEEDLSSFLIGTDGTNVFDAVRFYQGGDLFVNSGARSYFSYQVNPPQHGRPSYHTYRRGLKVPIEGEAETSLITDFVEKFVKNAQAQRTGDQGAQALNFSVQTFVGTDFENANEAEFSSEGINGLLEFVNSFSLDEGRQFNISIDDDIDNRSSLSIRLFLNDGFILVQHAEHESQQGSVYTLNRVNQPVKFKKFGQLWNRYVSV